MSQAFLKIPGNGISCICGLQHLCQATRSLWEKTSSKPWSVVAVVCQRQLPLLCIHVANSTCTCRLRLFAVHYTVKVLTHSVKVAALFFAVFSSNVQLKGSFLHH